MRDDAKRGEGRWEEYVSVANLVEKDKKESSTCSSPSFSDNWCTSLDNVDTTLNNKFSEVKGREECAGMTHGTPYITHTRTHTHKHTTISPSTSEAKQTGCQVRRGTAALGKGTGGEGRGGEGREKEGREK